MFVCQRTVLMLLPVLTACVRTIPSPPPMPLPAEVHAQREEQLAEARRVYERNREDADAILTLGIRTASLRRYRDAITIFTDGVKKHPRDPRMYRQRGQRWITLRQLDLAIRDFSRAATLVAGRPEEAEPNATMTGGVPSTTLQSNIWYYLGLSHYLRGDFDQALRAYRQCRAVSKSPDDIVSSSYWLYMTLDRLERAAEAERVLTSIGADPEVIDNGDYLKLLRMFRGDVPPEEMLHGDPSTVEGATQLYAVARWGAHHGYPERVRPLLEKIVAGGQWMSFAYMAAEADLRQ